MIKNGKVFCDKCKEEIYKKAYRIDKTFCNRCFKETFGVDVRDLLKENKGVGVIEIMCVIAIIALMIIILIPAIQSL